MDGFKYEHKCAAKLRRAGFRHVTVTRESGDQGLDVIAYRYGRKYGIQCKYYRADVGNKAVQEAHTGAKFYDCKKAVVMTNADFTRAARELASRTDVQLWAHGKVSRGILRRVTEILGLLMLIGGLIAGFLALRGGGQSMWPQLQAWVLALAEHGAEVPILFREGLMAALGGLTAIIASRNRRFSLPVGILYLLGYVRLAVAPMPILWPMFDRTVAMNYVPLIPALLAAGCFIF